MARTAADGAAAALGRRPTLNVSVTLSAEGVRAAHATLDPAARGGARGRVRGGQHVGEGAQTDGAGESSIGTAHSVFTSNRTTQVRIEAEHLIMQASVICTSMRNCGYSSAILRAAVMPR